MIAAKQTYVVFYPGYVPCKYTAASATDALFAFWTDLQRKGEAPALRDFFAQATAELSLHKEAA